jgi:hypothetical protein
MHSAGNRVNWDREALGGDLVRDSRRASSGAASQRTATMTGSPVYRGYDKTELDRQYNNRQRFPHYEKIFKMWQDWSAAARVHLAAELDLAYGTEPTQRLDVFRAPKPNAPIYVFLHGGYWQSLDKADYSFIAEGMVPNGVMTVVPNFALAPRCGMDEIVRQTRAAIAWLGTHGRELGGDPARIYVGGHSAGGHLATMLLATDWPEFGAGLPRDLVKGVCAISALFDMEPIRLCYLNNISLPRRLRSSSATTSQKSTTARPWSWRAAGASSAIRQRCGSSKDAIISMSSTICGTPRRIWSAHSFDISSEARSPRRP